MTRFALFLTAVAVLYIGGFVYDEVGPLLYALILAIIVSTPLLLKLSFWKKLIFMLPLLVLRVIGKVFLTVFGKNALSKLLARYGLLERRYNQTLKAATKVREQVTSRWTRMSRRSQAYLILIFLPAGVVIFLLVLIIKFFRFRFLQFVVEKTMQTYLMRWTVNAKSFVQGEESTDAAPLENAIESDSKITPEADSEIESEIGSEVGHETKSEVAPLAEQKWKSSGKEADK